MRKILFVLGSMKIGGSATSLLNVLELLNKQGYEVDLLLLQNNGIFLDRAKNVSNLIEEDFIISTICGGKSEVFKKLNIKKFIVVSLYALLRIIIGSNKARNLFFRWRANRLSNKYDIVVAYQEEWVTDYVQYIYAEKKIAWIHTQFNKFAGRYEKDKLQKLYNRYDNIVCVCDSAKNDLIKTLDGMESKVTVIQNILNIDYVIKKSKEEQKTIVNDVFTIVSVGHFSEWKKFERAVEVSKKLIDEGYRFKWYLVGDGVLFNSIKTSIKKYNLTNIVILLGSMSNPYPVIKNSDILVITSEYEAHPMVAIESYLLDTPVISTAFSSAKEVINHEIDGLICDNDILGVYNGVKKVLDSKELFFQLKKGAQLRSFSNDSELKKMEELLMFKRASNG